MSGGVDSSVAAAHLVEQGYDVVGLTMQLYDHGAPLPEGTRACCALDDVQDARRVAQTLGIPFYVVNLEEQFRDAVIKDFIDSYAGGETPNPCVRCNQILKFDFLLKRALELEADFLATGHYAIRREGEGGASELWRGADPKKDQSYFLFATTTAQLEKIRFPLGDLTKEETRALGEKYGLHNAAKRESQDVCFVPDGDYAAFFEKQGGVGLEPGEIAHEDGRILGRHKGLACYTIGQRKGLGIAAPDPLYVTAIDVSGNRLVVGPGDALFKRELTVREMNWLVPPEPRKTAARIRYASPAQPATIEPLGPDRVKVTFEQPQRAVTPGQACVLYDGDRVLGGGWIEPSYS